MMIYTRVADEFASLMNSCCILESWQRDYDNGPEEFWESVFYLFVFDAIRRLFVPYQHPTPPFNVNYGLEKMTIQLVDPSGETEFAFSCAQHLNAKLPVPFNARVVFQNNQFGLEIQPRVRYYLPPIDITYEYSDVQKYQYVKLFFNFYDGVFNQHPLDM